MKAVFQKAVIVILLHEGFTSANQGYNGYQVAMIQLTGKEKNENNRLENYRVGALYRLDNLHTSFYTIGINRDQMAMSLR
jgi:hypothetical protein